MDSLLKNRDYRLFLVGQGSSALGDVVTQTALPLLVLQLTGSATVMGEVGLLQSLPTVLFGLWAGALADVWSRKRMMVTCDAVRTCLAAAIPAAVLLHFHPLAVIFAVAFPLGVLHNLFEAASLSSVPSLVGAAHVGRANALLQATSSVGLLMGPALAGILSGRIGPGPTLSVDAASFLVSAVTVAAISRELQAEARPSGSPSAVLLQIHEGLRYLRDNPPLLRAMLFWSVTTFLSAPLIPVVTYYVVMNLHRRPADFGWVVSAFCVGMVTGALLTARLTRLSRVPWLYLGAGLYAMGLVVLVLVQGELWQLAIAVLCGVALSLASVTYATQRSALTPDAMLGRVSSIGRVMTYGLNPLAMLGGGLLADSFGGGRTLMGLGGCILTASLIFGFASRTDSPTRRSECAGPGATPGAGEGKG